MDKKDAAKILGFNDPDKGCPFCGKKIDEATEFKDDLSRKEYKQSGLCQKCQDEMFGA